MRHRPPPRHSLRRLAAAQALLAPFPAERTQHNRVLSPGEQIAANGAFGSPHRLVTDARGTIGSPYRAVDTLEAMEAAGTITRDMRKAGDEFRDDFALGQHDALQAADMERALLGTSGGAYRGLNVSQAAESARNRVWRKIGSVGGIASPGGSCLWYVLGWQISLRRWATEETMLRHRRTSPEAASGILRSVLGALANDSR